MHPEESFLQCILVIFTKLYIVLIVCCYHIAKFKDMLHNNDSITDKESKRIKCKMNNTETWVQYTEVPGEEIGWEIKGSVLRGSGVGFPEKHECFAYYMQYQV